MSRTLNETFHALHQAHLTSRPSARFEVSHTRSDGLGYTCRVLLDYEVGRDSNRRLYAYGAILAFPGMTEQAYGRIVQSVNRAGGDHKHKARAAALAMMDACEPVAIFQDPRVLSHPAIALGSFENSLVSDRGQLVPENAVEKIMFDVNAQVFANIAPELEAEPGPGF